MVFDRHFSIDYLHGDKSVGLSGRHRLRAWLRRMILAPPQLVVILDLTAEEHSVARENLGRSIFAAVESST